MANLMTQLAAAAMYIHTAAVTTGCEDQEGFVSGKLLRPCSWLETMLMA